VAAVGLGVLKRIPDIVQMHAIDGITGSQFLQKVDEIAPHRRVGWIEKGLILSW
jgi:hypothetical protein